MTGLAGSGKSTFAFALADKTGLPVIHLDLISGSPGGLHRPNPSGARSDVLVLAGDAWIANSNYTETLDLRVERADTVVVLDMPWWLCSGRAFLRGFRMPGELPEGCDYSDRRRLRDEWLLAVRSGGNVAQNRTTNARSFRSVGTVTVQAQVQAGGQGVPRGTGRRPRGSQRGLTGRRVIRP